MRVIIFGATGMIGSGVLTECLEEARVGKILVLGRQSCGVTHPRLSELVRPDLFNYSDMGRELAGYDACFFCLGVSAVGLTEPDYRRVTYDLTLAAAEACAAARPGITFCYISGEGADSSEHGRTMWARVKGQTENRLLALPLNAFMFRPGYIQPMKGVRSKTRWYQLFYDVFRPLYPTLRRLAPRHVTTTENVGRAMIAVTEKGYPRRILENPDINTLAAAH